MKRSFYYVGGMLVCGLWMNSCIQAPDFDSAQPKQEFLGLQVPANFNHTTTQTVAVSVSLKDNADKPIGQIPVVITTQDAPDKVLFTGATDASGVLSLNLTLPSYVDKLVVSPNYVGLPNQVLADISGQKAQLDLGGSVPKEYATLVTTPTEGGREGARTQAITYSYLGTWNSQGVPNYKEAVNDVISAELLSWINASLPERKPVPSYHPDYLQANVKTSLKVTAVADVWVTFVHEGAGWTNTLGYYTYPTGNPPASINDITNVTIVYPNVSFAGSGGGLQAGMKVNIGRFQPGTTISFVLISKGWSGGAVGNGVYRLFADHALNPEATTSLRMHNVLLYDDVRKITVLGFEDTRRDDAGCDHDFNDAMFYVSSNPVTAINTAELLPIDRPIDTDSDGINDPYDKFPTDATKAFVNYYPAQDTPGTLAFEDQWPSVGDYDVNDLVVKYYHTTISNAQNKVLQLKTDIVASAVGATFKNGFGLELPISPSKVQSVTGHRLTENMVTLASNGLEAGQSKSVIVAFDNAFSLFPSGAQQHINVVSGATFEASDTIKLTVNFTTPLLASELGDMVFNPFLISDGTRGREVHLAGYTPTNLAATSMFGTNADDSKISLGRYYKTVNSVPWAIQFSEPFDYPSEGKSLTETYPSYATWAQSGGASSKDWYLDKPGNRTVSNLYQKLR